jgi:hypothetical protein
MPAAHDWSMAAQVATADLQLWEVLPVIPTWSRLEPLPLTTGDLTPGVQALVADPLWLLGRQWQFDELRGEDAGSPVRATVRGETAPFTRFRAGLPGGGDAAADAVDIEAPGTPGALPLEARVEAELPAVLPLRLRTQSGLHLTRLLRAAGHGDVAAAAAGAFPVRVDAEPGMPDPAGEARERLAAGRLPDGSAVLAALAAFDDGAGGLTGLPVPLATAAGGAQEAVRDIVVRWRAWATGLLTAPTGDSWDPRRLEHAFVAQASLSDGAVAMHVEEYTGGTLDWMHGDLAAGPDLGVAGAAATPTPVADTTLPTPVRFAGMPNDRLFAFEDSAVYLGGLQAGRTDLARLAVVEFALAYSVDWFQVPLILPYGSVTRLDRVQVVDSFGVTIDVEPAREATSPGWAAFQSTPVGDTTRLADMFVLAQTVPRVLEGPPLEEVLLFRDEMANLVWGVERIVPGRSSGEPVPRAQQAAKVSLRQSIPDDLGDAQIIYRLMTPVPDNWLPFVAVRERPADATAHHLLERRPMLRYHDDGTAELVNPRGTVLLTSSGADPATDRLRIAEEEVPREGVLVTRSFQQARTEDGGTVLWIGRQVRVGYGEGASGLRFDTALPPGAV